MIQIAPVVAMARRTTIKTRGGGVGFDQPEDRHSKHGAEDDHGKDCCFGHGTLPVVGET